MNINKKAVTLVEVLICVALSVVILIGILNLFGSALKGSAKTLTMQDNIETANILISQIEHDLLNATEIIVPDWNEESIGLALWIYDSKNTDGSIGYAYDYVANSKDGVHRKTTKNNISQDYYFAKGHLVDLKFKHFAVDTYKDQNNEIIEEKHGMWVELTVYSKEKNEKDSFTIKRLIPIKKPI